MVLKDDDSYTCTPCSFVEFLFFMGPNDESLKKKKAADIFWYNINYQGRSVNIC